MNAPDIVARLSGPVDLADIKLLLREARDEIIGLRMLANDRICAHCGGDGHRAAECPWKES